MCPCPPGPRPGRRRGTGAGPARRNVPSGPRKLFKSVTASTLRAGTEQGSEEHADPGPAQGPWSLQQPEAGELGTSRRPARSSRTRRTARGPLRRCRRPTPLELDGEGIHVGDAQHGADRVRGVLLRGGSKSAGTVATAGSATVVGLPVSSVAAAGRRSFFRARGERPARPDHEREGIRTSGIPGNAPARPPPQRSLLRPLWSTTRWTPPSQSAGPVEVGTPRATTATTSSGTNSVTRSSPKLSTSVQHPDLHGARIEQGRARRGQRQRLRHAAEPRVDRERNRHGAGGTTLDQLGDELGEPRDRDDERTDQPAGSEARAARCSSSTSPSSVSARPPPAQRRRRSLAEAGEHRQPAPSRPSGRWTRIAPGSWGSEPGPVTGSTAARRGLASGEQLRG